MLSDIDMEIINEYGEQSLLLKLGNDRAQLDASQLDQLVEYLSTVRSDVGPETSDTPALSHQYVIETAPRWQTVQNPLLDGLVVFFRHSGYGWTGCGLPRASIERLSEIMAPLGASHASERTRLFM